MTPARVFARKEGEAVSDAVKERPILFSAPMVRALLAGAKTQTRRAVTLRGAEVIEERSWQNFFLQSPWPWSPQHDGWVPCPCGAPGDRLWVRETWAPLVGDNADAAPEGVRACYRADKAFLVEPWRWRPSIHMPRWASRITLEVTGVRVERLQDISEEDARAEGVEMSSRYEGRWRHYVRERESSGIGATVGDACGSFCSLWESINGAESWASNPWVWVVSFKRVTP